MFSKNTSEKRDKHTAVAVTMTTKDDVPSIISADLRIVGNLVCGGGIEIEGEVQGNVTCNNVTIRRTGEVKGDVIADSIQIDGEVNGLVKGKRINISESGRVVGVLIYESLSVKEGAYIDGQCKSADTVHHGDVQAIEQDETQYSEIVEEIAREAEEEVAVSAKKK